MTTESVVVVGAGLAGLAAATRLAEAGVPVVVVAKGNGSLPLSGGTIDVLGYRPERVRNPAAEWAEFVAARPHHPYAQVPVEAFQESLEWFKAQTGDLRYVGHFARNFLLPTALGALKPSAVVPQTMASGHLARGGAVAVVGWPALKDFHASLVAANLSAAGLDDGAAVQARAVEIDLPTGGEADVSAVRFARWFDEPSYRAELTRRLLPALAAGDDLVAVPAVLGLAASEQAWEEMEAVLERPVFEIPTVPPSVPGLRLFTALKRRLHELGGRLTIGAPVTGVETEGGRVVTVHVESAARTRRLPASALVLATGGWMGGGLTLDSSWRADEPVLGLPVSGLPGPGEARFRPGYLDDHPLATAGVAVDQAFRPVDGEGNVLYENVYAAGALLGGAQPWREKSGDGLSLITGYCAAGSILGGARR